MKELILKGIVLLVFFLIGFGTLVFYHENAHGKIFQNYGENYKIVYFGEGEPKTIGNCPNQECWNLHSMNEIVGYTAVAVILNMWLIFMTYLLWREK